MTRSAFAAALIAAVSLQVAGAGSKDKDAKPIVIDGQLNGNDPKDAKLKDSRAKLHKVELRQGVVYVIDLVSKEFDAYLRLEDAAGKPLGEDNDGGGGTNARLFFIPPASAEYTIVATSYKPKTGNYRLTVQPATVRSEPLQLEAGSAEVKDKLTLTGPRSPFSPHNNCKLYRVELHGGKTYVIDLESTAFDAYLTLSDATLRQLASDDDSGGKRNARIRFECKDDGTYYLAATGLGHPEGAFRLKMRGPIERKFELPSRHERTARSTLAQRTCLPSPGERHAGQRHPPACRSCRQLRAGPAAR